MQERDGQYVCDSCDRLIPPTEPGGPFVPFMILGKAIGGERWVACSEGCRDDLVAKYYRVLHGEE
jgi:hypothetical protein